jgi:hypothetical protein
MTYFPPNIAYLLKWSLVWLGCWLCFRGPAQAEGPPVTIEAYWQMVQASKDQVAGLADLEPAAQQRQLQALAEQWTQMTAVTLADGSVLPLNHPVLLAEMRRNPPDVGRLEALLAALLAAQQAWPASRHSAADIDRLQAILARSEFQWPSEAPPSPLALWWRRILRRILEFLDRMLPDQALINLNGSLFNFLVTGLALLLLLGVLFFIGRELLANLVAEEAVEAGGLAGDDLLTAESALKRAQHLSEGGDYRTAVRYLYLSALLLLDERRLLRYERSQTNREYLRRVAHLPKLAGLLREVIDIFDQVWYGYQPLDEATYSHYAARVAELRQQR